MSATNSITPVIYRVSQEFPDYKAGDDGSVWSASVSRTRGLPDHWKQLKPRPIKGGYQLVALYRDGVRSDKLVQRFILETFVGPCPEGMEACHADHNPKNNRLDNLSWGTHQENMQQSKDAGRPLATLSGEGHSRAKLSPDDILEIRRLVLEGENQTRLAERFGVTPAYIGAIARGRSWSHLALEDAKTVDAAIQVHRWRNVRASNSKLDASQVVEIRRLANDGVTIARLSRRFEVSRATVVSIIKRATWKDVG